MSNIPSDLRFAKTHEWVRQEEDGTLTVGISDYAQSLLGDLVFVELAEIENEVKAGDDCSVVESVKAASDIYAPVSGEIVEVNEALDDSPEIVNTDPYGDGWLFKLRPVDKDEIAELLDAESYAEHIAAEE